MLTLQCQIKEAHPIFYSKKCTNKFQAESYTLCKKVCYMQNTRVSTLSYFVVKKCLYMYTRCIYIVHTCVHTLYTYWRRNSLRYIYGLPAFNPRAIQTRVEVNHYL